MTDVRDREELVAVPRLRLEKLEAEVAALTAFVRSVAEASEPEPADQVAAGFERFRAKRRERHA